MGATTLEPGRAAHTALVAPEPAAPVQVDAAGSVTELLRIAVERGTPVEQLKELVALHEHMSQREAAKLFFAALAAFRAACPSIKRGSTAHVVSQTKGTKFDFQYASLDQIAAVVDPLLAKNGLSYGWNSAVSGALLSVECTLRHEAGHSITSSMTLPHESNAAMNPQQKYGAAMTFAQRRTLSSILGITTTDEDQDAAMQADADPTPISDDQLTVIEDLIEAAKANVQKFTKYMGVTRLDEIRAADFDKATNALNSLKAKKEAAQ